MVMESEQSPPLPSDRTLRLFLRQELEKRGWRQRDLARRVDRSDQVVSRWLSEEEQVIPKPDACEAIAHALGVDPDYVLMLAGHRTPRPGDQVLQPEVASMLRLIEDGWERTPPDQRAYRESLARTILRTIFPETNSQVNEKRSLIGNQSTVSDPNVQYARLQPQLALARTG